MALDLDLDLDLDLSISLGRLFRTCLTADRTTFGMMFSKWIMHSN